MRDSPIPLESKHRTVLIVSHHALIVIHGKYFLKAIHSISTWQAVYADISVIDFIVLVSDKVND